MRKLFFILILSLFIVFCTLAIYTGHVLSDWKELITFQFNPISTTSTSPSPTPFYSESPLPSTSISPSPMPTSSPSTHETTVIKMVFAGDVMMDDIIGQYIQDFGVQYPWTEVAPILSAADLSTVNLETSVSTRGETYKPSGFGFRSHPDTIAGLVYSGIDFVSLANNHSLDFGDMALADTLETLKRFDISYSGAGINHQMATKLAILERHNLKIGFLAYTSILPYEQWVAQDDRSGVAALKPEYYEQILTHITESNQLCDILIVELHWGVEYSNQVELWQRELAKKMIDAGADGIVGHHPHVLRGIEIYQNKPILYSTGNFVFLKRDEQAGQTAIFELSINPQGFLEGLIRPIYIQYGKATVLQPNQPMYQEIIAQMQDLSKPLGTKVTQDGFFFPLSAAP